MGKDVRAKRVEAEIPLDPFTAGVYVATMMATVQVRARAQRQPTARGSNAGASLGFWGCRPAGRMRCR